MLKLLYNYNYVPVIGEDKLVMLSQVQVSKQYCNNSYYIIINK